MNLIEILKAKGISEELIQAIQEDMRANSIYTASEENLDIRYGKLKTQNEGNVKELETTKAALEDLRKSTKGQEDLQKKLTEYDTKMAQLQEENENIKFEAEAKMLLTEAKAVDVKYMLYLVKEKLKEDGKQAKLDENGKIPDWDKLLSGLQTQSPNMFLTADEGDDGYKVLNPNKLKNGDNGELNITKERFMGMSYEERMNLKQNNEKRYNELAK